MADRAKRGLREKGGRELVTLDMVDFGLFDGSSAMMQRKESFILKLTHVLCVWREREKEQEMWWSPVMVTVGWRELGLAREMEVVNAKLPWASEDRTDTRLLLLVW